MEDFGKPSSSSKPNVPQAGEDTALEESSSQESDEDVMDATSQDKILSSLDDWTKEDKFQLYLGLKQAGSKNVKALQEYLPKKTPSQIKSAIHHYKKRAHRTPECHMKKLTIRKKKKKTVIPLASWAKLLTDKLDFKELQTEMVSALRLIADFDNIPHPNLTQQIDIRQAYHQIAAAMEGKPLTHTKYISELLRNCIFEAALLSKSFIAPSTLKTVLSSIDFNEPAPAFPKISPNYQESIIRRLASEKNYNPLGLSLSYLLPAAAEQIVKPNIK